MRATSGIAARGWDRDVRAYRGAHGIVYQGFPPLMANRQALAHTEPGRIAARHGRSAAQVVFRFALEVGMVPLTGTTDPAHLRPDLEVFDFRLNRDAVGRVGLL